MTNFVFMPTRNDETVSDALSIYQEVGARVDSLKFVGFKEVGLSEPELQKLTDSIKKDGRKVVLELVTTSEPEELQAAEMAQRLGVHYVIGGVHKQRLLEEFKSSDLKYFPNVGDIFGPPSRLEGSVESIKSQAQEAEALGADGVMLLAYRYLGDGLELAETVNEAIDVPVLCAGSVDSFEKISALQRIGVWGFTLGSAILDKILVPGSPLDEQVEAVLAKTQAAPHAD